MIIIFYIFGNPLIKNDALKLPLSLNLDEGS